MNYTGVCTYQNALNFTDKAYAFYFCKVYFNLKKTNGKDDTHIFMRMAMHITESHLKYEEEFLYSTEVGDRNSLRNNGM